MILVLIMNAMSVIADSLLRTEMQPKTLSQFDALIFDVYATLVVRATDRMNSLRNMSFNNISFTINIGLGNGDI